MKKILVANRGEIAIRVMKTAKRMGIKTVAIYSTADRQSPHVRFADEAVLIGEGPSNQSYLLGDKIIEVAKNLNVDAIHPGYGFLSENADFAEACETNGIIFIGPKSQAIKIMGNKLAAKEAVKQYDIPMVPGIDEAITDVEKATQIAEQIGFPILIKAAAGGGGDSARAGRSRLANPLCRAAAHAAGRRRADRQPQLGVRHEAGSRLECLQRQQVRAGSYHRLHTPDRQGPRGARLRPGSRGGAHRHDRVDADACRTDRMDRPERRRLVAARAGRRSSRRLVGSDGPGGSRHPR